MSTSTSNQEDVTCLQISTILTHSLSWKPLLSLQFTFSDSFLLKNIPLFKIHLVCHFLIKNSSLYNSSCLNLSHQKPLHSYISSCLTLSHQKQVIFTIHLVWIYLIKNHTTFSSCLTLSHQKQLISLQFNFSDTHQKPLLPIQFILCNPLSSKICPLFAIHLVQYALIRNHSSLYNSTCPILSHQRHSSL